MLTHSETPLHLFQVLEEEYLSLHGQLSSEEKIELHGRPITARLDWQFYEGHIKDPAALLAKLLDKRVVLTRHLDEALGTNSSFDPFSWAPGNLLPLLNELLRKHIYNEEAFKYVTLKDSTKKLARDYQRAKDRSSESLAHVNRLLLEEAYPNELEKISDIRLAAIYQRLHSQQPTALCLSGGGIRSGTFALGLLQGLARHDLLKSFDYLSTVSGGGYIGSWLTAWLHRHPRGLSGVTESLAGRNPESKIDPDPDPVQHLRKYSNFITPQVGLLTADTWTFLGIYLRNLLLNWMVFIPLLIAVLAVPRLYVAIVLTQPKVQWVVNSAGIIDVRFNVRHVFLLAGCALLVLALSYINFVRPGVSEQLVSRSRFWRNRMNQRSFVLWCLVPLTSAAFCMTVYWAWSDRAKRWQFVVLAGLLLTGAAWLTSTLVLRRFKPSNMKEISLLELITILFAGAIGGAISYFVAGVDPVVADVEARWTTELYVCFAVPLLLTLFLLATTIFVGITSHLKRIDDQDREWWARFSAWVIIVVIAWSVFSVLVLFGPLALLRYPEYASPLGGLSGLIAVLVARSAKTPLVNDQQHSKAGRVALVLTASLPLLALVFLAVFVALLSLITSFIIDGVALLLVNRNQLAGVTDLNWMFNIYAVDEYFDRSGRFTQRDVHMWAVHYPSIWFVSVIMFGLLIFGAVLARLINLNIFSLHRGYRNRLIRGFLAASRNRGERKPNPFTGFDPADNIQMHELRPALLHEVDVVDFGRLAAKLQRAEDPMSRYLLSLDQHLADTRLHLNNFNADEPPPQNFKVTLMEDLNRVMEDRRIRLYEDERFAELFRTGRETRKRVRLEGATAPNEYHIFLNRMVLEQAYPAEIRACQYPPYRLFHVVNIALNLVGGDNLAWQHRKAESFTVSPLHAGCFRLGYRNSRDYGGQDGISIGTAVAVSGAAASSNMGYYTTSPVLSLLMTLFNVRLGWWLGNPGPAGQSTFRRMSPKYSVLPIVSEAFGLTDDKNEHVYLSDGGHFENLALYEMVLRRCHVIVASDGAQDEKYEFNDLGNAVRKIRIDLGIPIEFSAVPIYAETPADGQGGYWALGRIHYSCVDPGAPDGILLYIKPAVYGNEPKDVSQYKKAHPEFPHESTGDQFFDEAQFESYRMLGSYIAERLCGANNAELDIQKLIKRAYEQLIKGSPPLGQEHDWGWLHESLGVQTAPSAPSPPSPAEETAVTTTTAAAAAASSLVSSPSASPKLGPSATASSN